MWQFSIYFCPFVSSVSLSQKSRGCCDCIVWSLQEHTVAHPAYPKEKDEVKNPEAEGPTGPQNQYPAEGLQVYLIAHGSHEKAEEDIWYCKQCGDNLADYLKNDLKIGSST